MGVGDKVKIDFKYVKEYVESFGYKLVSKEYIRSSVKMDMICENGHDCSISWDNFKYGRRCKTCSNLKKSKMFRLDYDEVKMYVEKQGCILVSEDYVNYNKYLDLVCSCGRTFKKSFVNFKQSPKCEKCSANSKYDRSNRKHSYDFIKSYVESFGYRLISSEYIGANEKIEVQCNNNHKSYKVKFSNFKSGKRCPHCSKCYKPNIEEVKDFVSSLGYECFETEYINVKQKLQLKCDMGHSIKMTLRELRAGCRCSICGESRGEQRISKHLKKHNINYIYNTTYFKDLISDIGNKLKPDFIIEELKVWIEYDGEFHYEPIKGVDLLKRQQYLDELKNEYANKNGWKLIRIPYWEFDNIENILNNNINNMK